MKLLDLYQFSRKMPTARHWNLQKSTATDVLEALNYHWFFGARGIFSAVKKLMGDR